MSKDYRQRIPTTRIHGFKLSGVFRVFRMIWISAGGETSVGKSVEQEVYR
jgi:hypothetical protein